MVEEEDRYGKFIEQFPDSFTEAKVAKYIGMSPRLLWEWRKKQRLINPSTPLESSWYEFYSQRDFARAIFIRQMRKQNWEFGVIRDELRDARWLKDEGNIALIQEFIDERGLPKDFQGE